jgi:hypothetical protein
MTARRSGNVISQNENDELRKSEKRRFKIGQILVVQK